MTMAQGRGDRTVSRLKARPTFATLEWVFVVLCAVVVLFVFSRGVCTAQTTIDPPRWAAVHYAEKDKFVGLRWNPVAGATSYRLWRQTGREADPRLLATVEGIQYLDRAVELGGSYRYRLQSVIGVETGPLSDEQTIRLPAPAVSRENFAPIWRYIGVQAVSAPGQTPRYQAVIGWQAVAGAIGYQLYRSRESGSRFSPLGFFTTNEMVDTAVELDQTYYYVVTAFDAAFRESSRSIEMPVRVHKDNVEMVVDDTGDRLFPAALAWEVGNEMPASAPSTRRAKLSDPFDLAYDRVRKRLYVSSTAYRHIVVIDDEGHPAGYLGPRFGEFELCQPLGLAVDRAGNLVVVDQAQTTLYVVSPDGALKRRIAVGGKGGEKPPLLMDAAVLRDGRIVVTDNANGKLLVLSPEGKLLARWGKSGGRAEEFAGIGGIEVTAAGTIAVADAAAGAIKLFSSQGKFLGALGGRTAATADIAFMGGFTALDKGRYLVTDLLNATVTMLGPAAWQTAAVPIGMDEYRELSIPGPVNIVGNGLDRFFVADAIGNRVICFRLLASPSGITP